MARTASGTKYELVFGMTPFATAYDNIRLIRRKIQIAEADMTTSLSRVERDRAIVAHQDLVLQLAQMVQGFAEAGYEERVARLIDGDTPT